MARYIDADKYIGIIKDDIADSYTVGLGQSSLSKERLRAFEDIVEDLENLEAEDVTPVVHAHWKWYEEWLPSTPEHPAECQEAEWICSNCESLISDEIGGYWDDIENPPKLKYCPHCGAKMDEENKIKEQL